MIQKKTPNLLGVNVLIDYQLFCREEGKRTYFVFSPVSAVFQLLYHRFATILPQSLFMRSKLRFLCLGGKGGIRTISF